MNTLFRKMMVKPGHTVLLLAAPADYRSLLKGEKDLIVSTKGEKNRDAALLFVTDTARLREYLPDALASLRPDGLLWICFPKKSSGFQTDLTARSGWDPLQRAGFRIVSLVSLDQRWSAARCRKQTMSASSTSPGMRSTIDRYVNSTKRRVRLPKDLDEALDESPLARETYDRLSFTCRKEYVRWILEARKEPTRKRRVRGAVSLLEAGRKSPVGER